MDKRFLVLFVVIIAITLSGCIPGDPFDLPNNMYYWFVPEPIMNPTVPKREEYYANIADISVAFPSKIYLDFYSYITISNIKVYKKTASLNFSPSEGVFVMVYVSLVNLLGKEEFVYQETVPLREVVHTTNIDIRFLVSGIDVGSYKLVVKVSVPSCCVVREMVFEKTNIIVLKGTKYYVSTIPIANSMNNPFDTIIYLYKKEKDSYFKVAEDDNSGYSGVMSKITKFLAPGEYLVKVSTPNLMVSNSFAIYFGRNEIVSNADVFIDSTLTNYSPDAAVLLVENVPTNSFLNQTIIERWFKFYIPE